MRLIADQIARTTKSIAGSALNDDSAAAAITKISDPEHTGSLIL
jgi:hypothetical protein